jgi:hypothetical protein
MTINRKAALAADRILEVGSAAWPDYAQEIADYLADGIAPGEVVEAILAGDLYGAACQVDAVGQAHLVDIARAVVAHCPPQLFGDPDKVRLWVDHRAAADGD